MNLHDAVYKRISTRTFVNKPLTSLDIGTVKTVLSKYETMTCPFGHSFELTFSINDSKETNGKKIGTYGLIKNVPAFIGGVCENSTESIIDFGYVFEYIILELTTHDLGTCWLGGTFKRKDYRKELTENEVIPAISPVGYRASNRSVIDKLLRSTAQSDNRLPFKELFLDIKGIPLQSDIGVDILDCLTMVRKGPSASNKQPWRMMVDLENQVFHVYIARTPNYAKFLSYDIQALDIGIALAHLEIGFAHYNYTFTRDQLNDVPQKEGWEYIVSYTITNKK